MLKTLIQKIDFNAPITLGFALICAIILIGSPFISSIMMGIPGFSFILYPLVHANFNHLFGNLTFLLLLGPMIEEKYGSKMTLLMIAVTSLVTGIINVIFFGDMIVGASGIVFMMIMLSSLGGGKEGKIPLTFLLIFGLYTGQEIWSSFQPDNISQFGHILGGICGSIFGLILNKVWKANKTEEIVINEN